MSPIYVFEDKRCYKRIPIFYKIKAQFVDITSHTISFTYATIKEIFSRNYQSYCKKPNIDLQSIGIYSRSDIQHHIRTRQFQELLTKTDTIQRQSLDHQNLRKRAETAGFSDIYTQYFSGFGKDINDYIYLNGENYRPQDISSSNIFSFVNLKNELLAFLGCPHYILERLTILYAMFNFFFGIIFSLLKGIYNTCKLHTQVKQTSKCSKFISHTFLDLILPFYQPIITPFI